MIISIQDWKSHICCLLTRGVGLELYYSQPLVKTRPTLKAMDEIRGSPGRHVSKNLKVSLSVGPMGLNTKVLPSNLTLQDHFSLTQMSVHT